ncbi:MAG: ketopantoate reductase family protein [Thermodesulfobacteriota bacterium]
MPQSASDRPGDPGAGGFRRIAVVGPGALGCLLAARLSRLAPAPLWLLDHDPTRAEEVDRSGLCLETAGRTERFPVRATADPNRIGPVDLVLFTVKSTAVRAAIPSLLPLLGSQSLLLAFQNGIGHLGPLADAGLPGILGLAVTTMGATLLAPGQARFGGAGRTMLGAASNSPGERERARLVQAAVLFNAAGMEAMVSDDILTQVWNKLLANVGINALTAIHGCENGGLLQRPEALRLLRAAVQEAAAIGRAKGISLSAEPVEWVLSVCRATAGNISSMLQDVRRRRPTEIDAINGAVVAEARRLGLPCAANQELVREIKALESAYLADFP